MFANRFESRGQRRGVVLVLILAMLGLLALIGVTFATFSGQAAIAGRNFAASQNFPDSAEMMDYALSQLIDDTFNPISALRGHSLKRDMYGNDASNNGFLTASPGNGSPLLIANWTLMTSGPFTGLIQVQTNVAFNDPSFYGLDFTRWILRVGSFTNNAAGIYNVAETFEVIADDYTGVNSGSRLLYVTPHDAGPGVAGYATPGNLNITASNLIGLPVGFAFTLDGRYLRAFNGPGMNYQLSSNVSYYNITDLNGNPTDINGNPLPPGAPPVPVLNTANTYGNFRLNGLLLDNNLSSPSQIVGNPNAVGMDEDYDACDLDNWFMAIQSADGQTIIPSFHRPAIIRGNNRLPGLVGYTDWQITPQVMINNGFPPAAAFDSMARILRPRTIDGHSSLSFPDLTPDSTTGRITYDIDNDGDGITDSVWLDLGYPPKRDPTGQMYKPLFSFLVVGLNGRLPLNTAGNLQSRDNNLGSYLGNLNGFPPGAAAFFPLGMPSSRLGNSPSEVDITYALQNAYDATTLTNWPGLYYTQTDDAGVPVNLTQVRNILAGTRPQDNPYAPTGLTTGNGTWLNADRNFVLINGVRYYMPNGVVDSQDDTTLLRRTPPVAGRWGEADFVPSVLNSNTPAIFAANSIDPVYYWYSNPVRAGLSDSPFSPQYGDNRDDNFTSNDTFPNPGVQWPPNSGSTLPEGADLLDLAGLHVLPVERERRFGTPKDVSGNGSVATYNHDDSGGLGERGADNYGRVMFRSYYRPPGYAAIFNSAGINQAPSSTALADFWTNPLHGFDALRNPFNTMPVYAYTPFWTTVGASNIKSLPLVTPVMPNPVPAPPLNIGSMPINLTTVVGGNNVNATSPPTFLSALQGVNAAASIYGLDSLNEADEMNPYGPSDYDLAYTASDLEWLYRQQDTDGASLTSRLAQLAPISFGNPQDGLRRRRLFSVDTWETTNFVWANDNPPVNTTLDANSVLVVNGAFPDNSRFQPLGNASMANLNVTPATIANYSTSLGNGPYPFARFSNLPVPWTDPAQGTPIGAYPNGNGPANPNVPYNNSTVGTIDPLWPPTIVAPATAPLAWTPQLAHRDRRVNLNFPLPVSNDCQEPIRQKWIRDTYTLLKEILPPHAVDTPQELAQLSQFVINIIDFRDPDATMTQFINPDVIVIPASPTATPPTPPSLIHVSQLPDPRTNATTGNLEQFGMEYNPIAINETLAYTFLGKSGGGTTPVNRFFVELVNVLSQSGSTQVKPPDSASLQSDFLVNASDASSPQFRVDPTNAASTPFNGLDLTNWEIWLGEDDANGRPDPTTGQIGALAPYPGYKDPVTNTFPAKPVPGSNYGPINLIPSSFVNVAADPTKGPAVVLPALSSKGTTAPAEPGSIKSADPTKLAANYYYVIGNALSVAGAETPTSTPGPNPTTSPYPSQIQTLLSAAGAVSPSGTVQTDWFDTTTPSKLPTYTAADTNTVTLTAVTPPGLSTAKYLWIYLRRPANPLLPPSAPTVLPGQAGYNPMVVVDSMRFPYINPGGTATAGTPDTVTPGANTIFSAQRYQPFRGGHAVCNPPVPAGGVGVGTPSLIVPAFGYSEQIVAPAFTSSYMYAGSYSDSANYPLFGTNNNPGNPAPPNSYTTNSILHTLGKANEGSMAMRSGTSGNIESWDYFAFNDRDFTSVAELMLVPGCPPGLFTKQFVENQPTSFLATPATNNATLASIAAGAGGLKPPIGPNKQAAGSPNGSTPSAATQLYTSFPLWYDPSTTNPQPVAVYPFLNDNFFYSAASQLALNPDANPPPGSPGPLPTNGPWWPTVGGPTGAGWHKVFDFFEVPSPAFGAIGEVASGNNYDWARQDRKPGLLNLNLIIDEEVFLGVMGNAGLRNFFTYNTTYGIQGTLNKLGQLNATPMGNLTPETGEVSGPFVPKLVTMTDFNGAPALLPLGAPPANATRLATYPMTNQGFIVNTNGATPVYFQQMKACFSDFVKLRHGGSGYIYAWGTGQTNQVPHPLSSPPSSFGLPPTTTPIAHERPFHSLSYPDIDYTVMRPAPVPPSLFTDKTLWSLKSDGMTTKATQPMNGTVGWDPGVKQPYLIGNSYVSPALTVTAAPIPTIYPPGVPPRRLFQIADGDAQTNTLAMAGTPGYIAQESNAAKDGDHYQASSPFMLFMNNLVNDAFLSDPNANLNTPTGGNNELGDRDRVPPAATPIAAPNAPQYDNRQHPYFRSEWMQRMMNLTTVRTHQYAVWVTVAFFEVTRQGDPMLANDATNNNNTFNWQLAYDILGDELNAAAGRNIRYRSFFVIDRTKATGFNPALPGDFHDCVVYRQDIQ